MKLNFSFNARSRRSLSEEPLALGSNVPVSLNSVDVNTFLIEGNNGNCSINISGHLVALGSGDLELAEILKALAVLGENG